MSFLISLVIGLGVGLLYGALDFRSPRTTGHCAGRAARHVDR